MTVPNGGSFTSIFLSPTYVIARPVVLKRLLPRWAHMLRPLDVVQVRYQEIQFSVSKVLKK